MVLKAGINHDFVQAAGSKAVEERVSMELQCICGHESVMSVNWQFRFAVRERPVMKRVFSHALLPWISVLFVWLLYISVALHEAYTQFAYPLIPYSIHMVHTVVLFCTSDDVIRLATGLFQ